MDPISMSRLAAALFAVALGACGGMSPAYVAANASTVRTNALHIERTLADCERLESDPTRCSLPIQAVEQARLDAAQARERAQALCVQAGSGCSAEGD